MTDHLTRHETWTCQECQAVYASQAAAHACEQRDVIESD